MDARYLVGDCTIIDHLEGRYPVNDHEQWMELLTGIAEVQEDRLLDILDWFRSVGTILIKDPRFKYRLQPIVAKGFWQTEAEYNREAKALVPYKALLVKLLGRLP